MRDGNIPDSDKRIFNRLLDLITVKNAAMYSTASVSAAICNSDAGQHNLLTKIEFLSSLRKAPEPARLFYRDVIFVRAVVQVDYAIMAIKQLVYEGLLRIPDFDNIPLEGNLNQPQGDLDRAWLYRSEWSQWPAAIFRFESTDMHRMIPVSEPLVALNAPYYRDLTHFLRDQFGVKSSNAYSYFNGGVTVIVPNFRARISKLTIGSGYIKAEIESEFPESKGLVAKVYAENEQKILFQGDVPLEETSINQTLTDQPTFASVVILSKSTGEPLDTKSFQSNSSWQDPTVKFEAPELEIEQLLLTGESETIEFRQSIDNPERFAKVVVAFANTAGGVIVVGVDDDHRVVGCSIKGLPDRVSQIIRAHCDPPPSVSIEQTVYDDKPLLLVRVPSSSDVVHIVRDRGPYIRANGTTRVPSSYELNNWRVQKGSLSLPL